MRISDWSSDVCSSDLRGFMTNAPPETPNVSLGSIRNSVLPIILVFEPMRAGRHDDFIALLFTETIFDQNAAFVLDTFFAAAAAFRRSEERRVGKEGVSSCRYR